MPKKLKIETWLKKLPEPHRALALKNRKDSNSAHSHFHTHAENLPFALWFAFNWSSTPEGHKFWQAVRRWADWQPAPPRPKLPKLPKKKK